jgi:hypothetical protein
MADVYELGSPLARKSYFGPDSAHTVIMASTPRGRFELASWHEQFEGNDRVVVTEAGAMVVESERDNKAVVPSGEYAAFLTAWNEIRGGIKSLVPSDGDEFRPPPGWCASIRQPQP